MVTSRQAGAFLVVALLAGVALFAASYRPLAKPESYERGTATINDLVSSTSERKGTVEGVVVSGDSKYNPLVGTPVALYYEKGGNRSLVPLLVQGKDDPSTAVQRFLSFYEPGSLVTIGDVGGLGAVTANISGEFSGSPTLISTSVAKAYWTRTDGAILIKDCNCGKPDENKGYEYGVNLVPLASYLDIPVIVTEKVDRALAGQLKALGVKYTIIAGDLSGYGKVMKFRNITATQDTVIQVAEKRLGTNVSYIAMANPLDTTEIKVLKTASVHHGGTIQGSSESAYPGAAPASPTGPMHNFTIPSDFTYASVTFDVRMDVSGTYDPYFARDGDLTGERIYAYIGIDADGDGQLNTEKGDTLQFFGGSPAYDSVRSNPSDPWSKPVEVWFRTALPYFNDTGTHDIQLMASLVSDKDNQASYTVDITIEKLSSPIYPLMPGISAMAPYLAAYHQGVVLADPTFNLWTVGYIGCKDCGDPASNRDVISDSNNHTAYVKKKLNGLLGRIAGSAGEENTTWKALAETYRARLPDNPMYLAIVADPNMVPQFYYASTGQGDATEGFGIPSDNIYSSIDADPQDPPFDADAAPPSFELPAGRVVGWNPQEVSALIARTAFYDKIISSPLLGNGVKPGTAWKDSAMNTVGTVPPVGSGYPTTEKLNRMWGAAGFEVDSTRDNELARRQAAYRVYEQSNFIFFTAHGFYYWYVPTAQEGAKGILPKVYGGGAFDVTHVKYMNFGPSVIFGSSCITGRIDGLQPYNALSQAFLHAGMNAYVGATRSSWGSIIPIPDSQSGEIFGDYLGLLFYGYLAGKLYDKSGGMMDTSPGDTTTGVALLYAKNAYVARYGTDGGGPHDDTVEEFILQGDPAFNPYEPNHEGSR